MDYEGATSALLWNLRHSEPEASKIYTDDAVLEFPQSGEQFRGKENFMTWRAQYPGGGIEFELRSVRGGGDIWVTEGVVRYEGGDPQPFLVVQQFRSDLVERETIYITGPFPAAEDRARYSSPTEPLTTPGLPVTVLADEAG